MKLEEPMFRILVVRLGSMGDVIHALPAVASLKHSFPHSRLSWVIKPRWAPLLEGNPYVDEIIPFTRSAREILATRRPLAPRAFRTGRGSTGTHPVGTSRSFARRLTRSSA